jgi:hypothetical protein
MAIVRKGVLSVVTGGVAQALPLGFVPSYFLMENKTKIIGNTNGVQKVEWWDDMVNGSAYIQTVTAGAPVGSYIAANGISPFQTPDSGLYPPSNLVITGISQAANAVVTAANSFTAKDVGVTVVTFHNVVGMTQINTLSWVVQSVIGPGSFSVNINSSGFSAYVSGGIANIINGIPALQGGSLSSGNALGFSPLYQPTSQVLNTALFNQAFIGLLLGTSIMVTTADEWQYLALLDASFTSD